MSSFTEGLSSKLKYKHQERLTEILPGRNSVTQHLSDFVVEISISLTCNQITGPHVVIHNYTKNISKPVNNSKF